MTDQPSRRRAGGREARRAAREEAPTSSAPYLIRTIPPYEIMSEDGLEIIENNADIILEEVGIDFRDYPSSLELLKNAGATIDGERVRFPKGMCREIVTKSAPPSYIQHARSPSKNVQIGGNATVLVPAYGSPFVFDLDNGRRYANIEDFRNFVKLAYMSPHLHHSGGTVVEPVDIPVSKRHLDMVYSHLKYSDKPFMGSVTAAERAQDSVALAEMVFGDGFLNENTVMTSLINASSPMCWDASMLGAAEVYARSNQATVISPFIVAGAMAPVTVAGVAAQTLAEALAGMTFIQLVNPGAPTVFGSFAMSMSMQTGAPTFGTPEPALILYTMAALARRLGVPFRSGGNLCSSKIPDAQAASESISTFIPAILGGVNFMLHSAGWLEGGLAMGYEKFIIDADQCGLAASFVKGVDLSENGQALAAIKETGPGQHFLGSEHTLKNFETAFAVSEVANNDSYEQWSEEGSLDAAQRANTIWKKMLNDYEPPPLDEAIDEAMLDFIAKRKDELPDAFA
ncbi:MAG: trimethylamine methyltransferase family protein [Acidimicrobiales bacterium]|jgi:trimethylamine--corrinoid protein Co-methyltransferase|nr:trimethylamine methyltransferase family protein [Acidimicrobiales bacterium]HJO40446.1 trimethylamine methyltransferase family protein [Acidimicrobiales bacterium]|tara:strand:+ start:723 stop:2264 length:1542 start_codon:yes stop_codon:yes gene_type:complete